MPQKYIRVGDTLTNIINSTNKVSTNYIKTTVYADGTAMNDTKVDGIIYRKLGTEYFMQAFDLTLSRILVLPASIQLKTLSLETRIRLRLGYYNKIETKGYYLEGDKGEGQFTVSLDPLLIEDNGSVFSLGLGMFAKLIPIQSISYTAFGAKLLDNNDNIANDSIAIQKCHIYANKENIPVVQNFGIVRLDRQVDVKTSLDLSGCPIYVGDFSRNLSLYKVTSKKAPKTITSFTQADLYLGSYVSSILSPYKNHMITFDSNELQCVRYDGGVSSNVYKKDSIFCIRGGYFTGGSLINDFTTGTVTLTATEYEPDELKITGIKIIWDMSLASYTTTVCSIERHNTTIRSLNLIIPNDSIVESTAYKGQVILIKNSCNITLEDIIAENITNGTNSSGYIVEMENCINVNYRNVKLLSGWGATGCNNIKNWNIYDSEINRVDIHINCGDLYFNNVKFIGGWGVYVGYGTGRIILNDCLSDFMATDGKMNTSVFRSHGSYGLWYGGTIDFRNHKIITRGSGSKELLSLTCDSGNTDYKIACDLSLPNLKATGIEFENINGETLTAYKVTGLEYLQTSLINNNKRVFMPKYLWVSNVVSAVNNNTSYICAANINVNLPVSLKSKILNATDIRLKDITQDLHTNYTDGFSSSDDMSLLYKPLIYFVNTRNDPALYKSTLIIDNCTGEVKVETMLKNVNIINAMLSNLDFTFDSAYYPERTLITNSTLYPKPNLAKTALTLFVDNMEIQDSLIMLTTVGAADLPFNEYNVVGESKNLFNNMFGGHTSLLTIDQVNKYSNFFRIYKKTLEKKGTFTASGTGQLSINIPHGLGAVPSYTMVTAKSAAARTAGIASWTESSTNIIITFSNTAAVGTNNLIFSWEARL